jgi:uncharacterized protein with FMN-binding domain
MNGLKGFDMNKFRCGSLAALSATVVLGSLGAVSPAMAGWLWTPAPDAAPAQLAAATSHDGTFTGTAYDAYWGLVQVQATIQGGRLVAVDVPQFPNHRSTSRAINRQALPLLKTEVIQAQSTRVNLISGATLTSQAYLRSLKSALKQAGY